MKRADVTQFTAVSGEAGNVRTEIQTVQEAVVTCADTTEVLTAAVRNVIKLN
jgi:hypothetical protein